MSNVPAPAIYLHNRFSLHRSKNTEFFAGKEQLLRNTLSRWKLIAGCGERGVKLGQSLAEPSLKMMHVWQLDSWPSVYEIMYELSEAKWYRALGAALDGENQHLLVNFASGYGIAQRSPWQSDDRPGYRYLFEELTLGRGTTMHAYLRELNWLAAELARFGFIRTWCARHITGRPGQICLLWQVPERVDVDDAFTRIAEAPASSARYAKLMHGLTELTREVQQPMYSERLDERIRSGEPAPIVPAISGPTLDQLAASPPRNITPRVWQ